MNKALIIVDVQRDFLPGGALAVPDGDKIIPGIVELIDSGEYSKIIATGDWHPPNHCSFIEYGGIWPEHCVKYSDGSMYPPELCTQGFFRVLKGFERDKEEYSGYARIHEQTTVPQYVDIVGLALDFCVVATALDFAHAAYGVSVYLDLTRAVTADGAATSILRLKDAGVNLKFQEFNE